MKTTIEKFYRSFKNLDAEGMAKCYHDNVVFEDPAFGVLKGEEARNMWRMLVSTPKSKNFKIEVSKITFKNDKGSATWQAWYSFGKKGRKVHNVIYANFEFEEGKIIRHMDQFNLYKWAKQALGLQGRFLGWTPIFKKKLNAQTNKKLTEFVKLQS